jgi:ubiquinone/menaquinone biosynthesis C-methylase UbiE
MIAPNIPELAPIMRHSRAIQQTRLLVAATHHLNVFEQFSDGPRTLPELQQALGLKERAVMVLIPALCAMGFLRRDAAGKFSLTDQGRYLTLGMDPNFLGYLQFMSEDPGVVEMAQRLRHDGPREVPSQGTAYIKEGDGASPMDDPETARTLTLRLAGRAEHLSPLTANALPKGKKHLLDVAGGSGFYSYAWLLANPEGTATVLDRPAVLKVAEECLQKFCAKNPAAADIKQRVRFLGGDMLADELPKTDILLAFSLFHDWPTETCEQLAKRFAAALNPGGELWVHDEFLNEELDGPMDAIGYSAHLFWVTKGRIYSRGEHYNWLTQAGLKPSSLRVPTSMNYSLISAKKDG